MHQLRPPNNDDQEEPSVRPMDRLENPRGLAPTMTVARRRVSSRKFALPPDQSVPRQNPTADFSANAPNASVGPKV